MTAIGGICFLDHFQQRESVGIAPFPSKLLDSDSRCSGIYRESVMCVDVLMTDTVNTVRKTVENICIRLRSDRYIYFCMFPSVEVNAVYIWRT